jgi:hypothetical protein
MADQRIPDYEQRFVEALKRGDVSVADNIFAPDCTIHITGSPGPITNLEDFKAMLAGTLARSRIYDSLSKTSSCPETKWQRGGGHGVRTRPLSEICPRPVNRST